MSKKVIQKKILNIIIMIFDPLDIINDDMDLKRDLNMDIDKEFELIKTCEYEFNIKLSLNEMKELVNGTVGDMVNFIHDFIKPFKD